MLEELHALTGRWPHMFTCSVRPRNMVSENVVNQGLRRLGYTPDQRTAHGFRAMAATLLNEMGNGIPTRSNANWRMSILTRSTAPMPAASTGTSA